MCIKILLVQPGYYTRYPPLGLLKLSSLHRAKGNELFFIRGTQPAVEPPALIYMTSLFTYSWGPVHKAAEYYRRLYPQARIVLGGIYASLMPEHAKLSGADDVHTGLVSEAERFPPDYSLVPEWSSSILFGTRGCIRKCTFCAVPRLEGKTWGPVEGIRDLVDPGHKKLILWDNNILGAPNWREVIAELRELAVEVDFNQGLDARLITEEVAHRLASLRMPLIRMAYDTLAERKALATAIPSLESAGFKRRKMIVYTLYNFTDNPQDFLQRVTDLLSWGVVSYPMRYEPLNSLVKNKYVSPHWTARQLEMVARARRVMGAGGAFPPYKALLDKFRHATSFEEAFSMRPGPRARRDPMGVAGIVEEPAEQMSASRAEFRELLNDPATLLRPVGCRICGQRLFAGEKAFAFQDYAGEYVGYVCPLCHPNMKWINRIWRAAIGEVFSGNGLERSPLPVRLAPRPGSPNPYAVRSS